MTYTTQPMKAKTAILNDKRRVTGYLNGYAIVDSHGSTFMIVYGENKRDSLIKYLNNE